MTCLCNCPKSCCFSAVSTKSNRGFSELKFLSCKMLGKNEGGAQKRKNLLQWESDIKKKTLLKSQLFQSCQLHQGRDTACRASSSKCTSYCKLASARLALPSTENIVERGEKAVSSVLYFSAPSSDISTMDSAVDFAAQSGFFTLVFRVVFV